MDFVEIEVRDAQVGDRHSQPDGVSRIGSSQHQGTTPSNGSDRLGQ
jgi:hypothetical protein